MGRKAHGVTPSAMDWATRRANDPAHRDEIEALMMEMDVEQDLIALREAQGMTQVQLAKRLGVSQPVIARIESGKAKNLELRTLVRVAAALGARVRISLERAGRSATKAKRAKKRAVA